ncbi:MAG: chemotaxis protein [Gammaproteobacteria bacterium]|nr:chemotaxis protein [Gammaproteobacteria bacterium]
MAPNSQANTGEHKVVAVASIAAELHAVMKVAWGVSLAAKNAKVMSAQAGEKALGFQPITNFIDEIAHQAISGVGEINDEALKLSRIAVYEQRADDAYRRFKSVMEKHNGTRYIGSLKEGMHRAEENMIASRTEFKKCVNRLVVLLDAMDECMLSACSIASVSRIVTSNTGEYRTNLQVVANGLQEAAMYIKKKVSDSYEHLRSANLIPNQHR